MIMKKMIIKIKDVVFLFTKSKIFLKKNIILFYTIYEYNETWLFVTKTQHKLCFIQYLLFIIL